MLQYLLVTRSIDIIVGGFNYNLLKVSENKFLDVFTDNSQMVNKPRDISGSLIDHVYIKTTLMKELFTNATLEKIYFSDHDAVRIIIEKILLIFILFHKIQYYQAGKKNLPVFYFFSNFNSFRSMSKMAKERDRKQR